jgi:undecaprenyl-diphosphatase
MNLLQAIILGIVQGLTEFIPISSTAHLVLFSRWTDIYGGNPQQITATIAVIQLGTLAAVVIYFASDIWAIVTAFLRDHWNLLTRKEGVHIADPDGSSKPRWLSRESWLGWLVILGSIPIGVFGIVFKDVIEGDLTKNLWLIATMLIVIALLLLLAEKVGSHRKEMKDLGVSDAVIVGFSQVLALIPGASRSGSTIMGGLFAGETRETAARFSFLLSIPAIAASGLLELREALHILPAESFVPLIAGTATAGIVGYLSIWFLLAYLKRNSTMIFIVYRLVLGGLIIALLWRGVIDP